MKKIYFLLLISISSLGQSTGDISFVAFNADGDDDFAIVALVDLAANTTIYFTDNEPNVAGNGLVDTNEGTIKWDSGAVIIEAGKVIVFTDTDSGSNPSFGVSIGFISYEQGSLNLSGLGDALYATIGNPSTDGVSVWLAGIQNKANNEGTNFSATGLTKGTTFIEFYSSGHPDGGEYTGSRTGKLIFSDYLNEIGNNTNWSIESSNGENILPINETIFEIAVASIGKNQIEGFAVYPNPVKNGSFRIISSNSGVKLIHIYDMLGKKVLSKEVRGNQNIGVENLNTGIYILKVEEDGKLATRKLVIK